MKLRIKNIQQLCYKSFLFFNKKEESIFGLIDQFQEIIDNNKADHFKKRIKISLFIN